MRSYKKTLAMTTSLLIALSMSVSGITAFASSSTTDSSSTADATVSFPDTIDDEDDDISNHSYSAYQIFKGNAAPGENEGERVLSNIEWGPGFTDAFITYLQELDNILDGEFDSCTSASDVADVLSGYDNDSPEAVAFAKAVTQYIKNNSSITATGTYDNGEITGLSDGYYIIIDNGTGKAISRSMLLIVGTSFDVNSATSKEVLPTLKKQVWDGDSWESANTATIGDSVQFRLLSEVPDMTGYDVYFFVVNDTLGPGFSFNNDVQITIADQTLQCPGDFRVYETANNGFEIVFDNFIQWNTDEYVNGEIEITYSALLTDLADLTQTGNPNEATLTYSNDPNVDATGDWDDDGEEFDPNDPQYEEDDNYPPENPDDPNGHGRRPRDPDRPNPGTPGGDPGEDPSDADVVGQTTPSKTVTYATTVKLHKTGVGDDEDGLAGAEFQLTGNSVNYVATTTGRMVEDENGRFYKLADGNYTMIEPTDETEDLYDDADTTYRLLAATATEPGETITITATAFSDANGYIEFVGLGAGTYTITELSAPNGYNVLRDEITLVIEAIPSLDGGCTWSGTATSGSNTYEVSYENNVLSFEVENRKGAGLPTTGSFGTKLFYLAGGILFACSAIYIVTKKRMRSAEI